MKINHAIIRQSLHILTVSAFIVSIFFKLKSIIMMGGTESISDSLEKERSDREEYPDIVDEEDSMEDESLSSPSPEYAKASVASGSYRETEA